MELDVSWVRDQFPAYDPGNPLGELAFFEAAGGSFPCRAVVERLTDVYTSAKVQPGHPFQPSTALAAAMDATHQRLAVWMGVDADEVLLGPSTTQHAVVLADAWRRVLQPGAAIVVTDQAHEANAGPWARLAEAGVEVRTWSVDPASGALDVADLRALVDDAVAVVAFPHVSNLLGHPNDVAAACDVAHEVGARAVVDGVAAAPHGLPWIDDLGADVYLFSSYKTFGPHQGVAVVRHEVRDSLPNQGHSFNADLPRKRLVPAGPDHAQEAALAGVVDYLEALDAHHHEDDASARDRARRVHGLLRRAEAARLAPLLDAITGHDELRVLGPMDAHVRVPTVAIELDREAAPVAAALGDRGVACGAGHFYSPRLTAAMGVDAARVLRLSFTHTTSTDDIDRAIAGLGDVLDGAPV